jgi:hypothetical protein
MLIRTLLCADIHTRTRMWHMHEVVLRFVKEKCNILRFKKKKKNKEKRKKKKEKNRYKYVSKIR